MEERSSIWDQWQELLHSENPDLVAILKLGAQFQAYFSSIESETLQVARMAGLTWEQLGDALGNQPSSSVATSDELGRITSQSPSRGSGRQRQRTREGTARLGQTKGLSGSGNVR